MREEAAARDEDNAAAAQADAMKGKLIIIPLGEDGAWNVYWSRPHRSLYRLKMNEHTGAHLRRMAKLADYARWLAPDLPPDAVAEAERRIMKQAKDWMLDETGGRKFNPDMLRGRGVWRDADGGIVYNAGDACFLVLPDGRMEQVDGVRGRYIYDAGAPLIHPADDALTDEEGARLVDFFTARPWVLPCAGELVAGWLVCAVLAGVLPYRPQVWVNAPAFTGKSALKRDMLRALGGKGDGEEVAGGHAVQLEGGDTTPNAVHQKIRHDALPVVFDEAESNGGERRARNMEGLLALVRSAATSGDVGLSKGGADGTAKNYLLRCCFLLFSIANNLDRAADTSRFLVLRLSPLMDDAAREAMWQRQEAARAMTQGQDFTARLFTRLLRAVPVMLDNARTIRKHLMDAKYNARRAEMLGELLAGAHALTKGGAVDDAYLEHAAEVAQAVEETQVPESDTQRCLDTLLGYSMPWTGGGKISVAQLCEVAARETDTERKQNACRALEALGLRWRGDLDALQVNTAWRGLRELYKGTDWEGGRVASMLAEGCKRDKKPNALGVWLQSCKVSGRPVWLPMIPAALVLPADG
ncbi:MAG: hypothetical protein Q4E43_07860 [Akkermansia sp.]|nr:hypothetical protein [Akkermansia sp.]